MIELFSARRPGMDSAEKLDIMTRLFLKEMSFDNKETSFGEDLPCNLPVTFS